MTTDPTQAAMDTARTLWRTELTVPALLTAIARALILARAEGMREAADRLESNGQPGYAIELRVRALELEQVAERITP